MRGLVGHKLFERNPFPVADFIGIRRNGAVNPDIERAAEHVHDFVFDQIV
jgi:hypothetical protein